MLTARDDLRTAIARLAALAGAEVDGAIGSAQVRAVWRSARVVVVGADLAPSVAAAGLPRRDGVVVVTPDTPADALWRSTVTIGALRLLTLPADERAVVEFIADGLDATPTGGTTVAILGGCGGAGASTLAAAIALTSARAGPTMLIDGDRLGGGLDVLLGAEQRPGARWPDLIGTRGRLAAAALTEAVVHLGDLALLSWDRSSGAELDPDAAAAVVNAAVRACEHVVIDLPRSLDPASSTLAAAADLVVLVVPATVRAIAAAATVAAGLPGGQAGLHVVVRDAGRRGLAAGEVAAALCLPVIATLRSESAVAIAAERGEPPLRRARGSLADACRSVLAATEPARVAA